MPTPTRIIEGDGLLGMSLACGDLDGDGFEDLAIARGESHKIGTVFGVVLFYGDGTWSGTRTQSDGVTFERTVLWPERATNSPVTVIETFDTDRDGKDEVLFLHDPAWLPEAPAALWVLPGGRHHTGGAWIDQASTPWTLPGDRPGYLLGWLRVLDDLDGDGFDELFLLDGRYGTSRATAGGRAYWLEPHTAKTFTGAVRTSWLGAPGDHLGLHAVAADLDGDGDRDLTMSSPRAMIGTASEAGRISVFASVRDVQGNDVDPARTASGSFEGSAHEQWLGLGLASVGDLDDDGCDDLLAWDPQQTPRTYRPGPVRLISGCRMDLTGGIEDLDAATALAFLGEDAFTTWAGADVHAGDIDGDGRPDLVFGDQGYMHAWPHGGGRIYVYLSSTMGW